MASSDTKQIAELTSPDILVTDKKINSMKEILPFLENAVNTGNPLLIICDDIEQEVNDLLSFAEYIYSEVEESLADIIKVYNYITEFKENQVTNFMEYVEETWKCNI